MYSQFAFFAGAVWDCGRAVYVTGVWSFEFVEFRVEGFVFLAVLLRSFLTEGYGGLILL